MFRVSILQANQPRTGSTLHADLQAHPRLRSAPQSVRQIKETRLPDVFRPTR